MGQGKGNLICGGGCEEGNPFRSIQTIQPKNILNTFFNEQPLEHSTLNLEETRKEKKTKGNISHSTFLFELFFPQKIMPCALSLYYSKRTSFFSFYIFLCQLTKLVTDYSRKILHMCKFYSLKIETTLHNSLQVQQSFNVFYLMIPTNQPMLNAGFHKNEAIC